MEDGREAPWKPNNSRQSFIMTFNWMKAFSKVQNKVWISLKLYKFCS